jgi:hypothetical protein
MSIALSQSQGTVILVPWPWVVSAIFSTAPYLSLAPSQLLHNSPVGVHSLYPIYTPGIALHMAGGKKKKDKVLSFGFHCRLGQVQAPPDYTKLQWCTARGRAEKRTKKGVCTYLINQCGEEVRLGEVDRTCYFVQSRSSWYMR